MHNKEAHARSPLFVAAQSDQNQQIADHNHKEQNPQEYQLLGLFCRQE